MATQLEPVPSCDILFPEEDSHHGYSDDSFYAPPSNSTYSSYSREVKYIFDPEDGAPRRTENNNYKHSPQMNGHQNLNNRTNSYKDLINAHSQARNRAQTGHLQNESQEDMYSLPMTGHRYNKQSDFHDGHSKSNGFQDVYSSQSSLYRGYENSYGSPEQGCHGDICASDGGSPGNRRPIVGYCDSMCYHDNCLRARTGSDLENTGKTHEAREERMVQNARHQREEGGYPSSSAHSYSNPPPKPCRLNRAGHGYVNTQHTPGKYVNFAARRRTWSPPTFSKVMGIAGSFPLRSYRSNDQLDVDIDSSIQYEESESTVAPPMIAPVSGMLNKTTNNTLIRPIAFKPIITPITHYESSALHHKSDKCLSSPSQYRQYQFPLRGSHDMRLTTHNQDDDCMAREYNGSRSQSTSNLSQGSAPMEPEIPVYQESHRLSERERPDSFNSSGHSNHSRSSHASRISGATEGYIGTPSPSDSGVELEAMLREKDAEIASLRSRMEQNEAVIIGVYKEKEQNWEMEIKDVAAAWEARVRQQQAKAFKTEQALLLQLFKLQQDRKALRQDVETLRSQRDHAEQCAEELNQEAAALRARAEELSWELGQKAGELSLLKVQLKDAKEDCSNRANDLLSCRAQLKDAAVGHDEKDRDIHRLQSELSKSRQEVQKLQASLDRALVDSNKSVCEQSQQTEETSFSPTTTANSPCTNNTPHDSGETARLKTELDLLRGDLDKCRVDYEQERDRWLDEKNKVILYQKHLQLNYVQMYSKNKRLETEIEQLMLEAENRELKLTPSSPKDRCGLQKEEEVLESTC